MASNLRRHVTFSIPWLRDSSRVSRVPGSSGRSLFPVELHPSIHNGRNVAPCTQKLHNLLSLACQSRPTRSGFGILLQPTQFVVLELKIHFAQSRPTRPPHGKALVTDRDGPGSLYQGLVPDRNENLLLWSRPSFIIGGIRERAVDPSHNSLGPLHRGANQRLRARTRPAIVQIFRCF
jgi:hypothetical protein